MYWCVDLLAPLVAQGPRERQGGMGPHQCLQAEATPLQALPLPANPGPLKEQNWEIESPS